MDELRILREINGAMRFLNENKVFLFKRNGTRGIQKIEKN